MLLIAKKNAGDPAVEAGHAAGGRWCGHKHDTEAVLSGGEGASVAIGHVLEGLGHIVVEQISETGELRFKS